MRGRATNVVLPGLVVLGLVALVAISATGSTPAGDGETRPPSETLLDAIFSVWIVAVALGAVLLVYGLTQRQAIARQVATGRYPRWSGLLFVCFLAVFGSFSYWRLSGWTPPEPEPEQEPAYPGATPSPGRPEAEAPAPYEPSISWIPIALVVGLVLAAAVAYVVSERRAQRGRGAEELAEQLAVVLDDTLDDLRAEADPRRAVIAAYARLERVLAANGVPRRPSETPAEYLPRILHELQLDSGAVERLTALFTRAKFSQHDVGPGMKEEAIAALEQVRDELRQDGAAPTPADAVQAVGARP